MLTVFWERRRGGKLPCQGLHSEWGACCAGGNVSFRPSWAVFHCLRLDLKGQRRGSTWPSRDQGSRVQDRDERWALELSLSRGLCLFFPGERTSEGGGSSGLRVSHMCPHEGTRRRLPVGTPRRGPPPQTGCGALRPETCPFLLSAL